MEFLNRIRDLAEKTLDLKDQLATEEATKNALIMPFISILGYDVFNPREVVPEFTADVGTKKGERVDYAIQKDGHPIILIECKSCHRKLDDTHISQLYRYFATTSARFGVLTNGLLYWFYTDLDAPNVMDTKPFLEVDILNIKENLVDELKKFTKESFDVEDITSTASELKHTREIRGILEEEYSNPSDEFVRFFGGRISAGRMTQQVRDGLAPLAKKAFYQFVNDKISERLKSALGEDLRVAANQGSSLSDQPNTPNKSEEASEKEIDAQIITTEEELHAYYLVKSLLYGVVEPRRVAIRDRISYCGVLLDDNNRKPICRLHFNTSQKHIGLFDSERKEERIPIGSVEEIYQFGDRLRETIKLYDSSEPTESGE